MSKWEQIGKDLAERVATGSRLPRLLRARHPDRIAVLAYHNVVPDGSRPVGDRSLHLPLERFRGQLDWLMEHCEVVGLEALRAPTSSSKPRAAITFDDAYRGAVTRGLPELARRGLPSTVFVCPGRLGGDGFWWDRVAGPDGLTDELRERALNALQGRDELVCESFSVAPDDLSPEYRPADRHELHQAPGAVTFASHTWSHPNLTRVSDEALRLELERSRAWIGETFGGRALTDHLTFPYGLWDERVVREATSVGYRWLYRVDGGLLRRGPDEVEPTPRPRINVPSGVSLRGFELRVSGLIG